MLLCSVVFIASDITFTTRHIHSWVSFLLWPCHFIISGAIVIALHSSQEAYWTPSDLRDSSSDVISFYLFTLRVGYWSGLPFPPTVDHVLSGIFTTACPSWLALHGMAHSFIELHKPLQHHKAVIHEEVLIYTSKIFLIPHYILILYIENIERNKNNHHI